MDRRRRTGLAEALSGPACQLVEGGNLAILAATLVETDSRIDEVIFDEC